MADDTKDRRTSGQTTDPMAAAKGGKRPYATLDLKATEIKITPVPESAQSYAHSAARGFAVPTTDKSSTAPENTPLPLAAAAYATGAPASGSTPSSAQSAGTRSTSASSASASSVSAASVASAGKSGGASAPPPAAKADSVVVHKRGGFFSHLAAGIVGGVLALAGSEWALPQLGLHGSTSRLADDTAAIGQRLQALEKKPGSTVAALEERLALLEKSAERIPALADAQSRLAADTKAALASKAGDSGMPEQLARISTIEEKMKALVDAGANDPNAGRIAQLAALTGKVADLETSLATQLTAFRKGVSSDVDARIASVTASTEAAKSGTQRIDKDVATVKSEAVALTERLQAIKADFDKLAANVKMAQEDQSSIKSALETVKASTAKPADVTAAVKPVGDKVSAIEQSVQALQKAEDDRRANSERVLLSLELQNLKRAVDGGQKYAAELASVKTAAAGKFDLSALEKFKDQGVPAQADLVRDFRQAANVAIDADVEPANGGVIDRLVAGAKSVVRVRKVNHAADDKSAEAIIGRMEVALKEGRLADVLAEAKQLSPKALAAAQPFLDRVSARASVDAAVSGIERLLKTSLSAAPQPTNKVTQ